MKLKFKSVFGNYKKYSLIKRRNLLESPRQVFKKLPTRLSVRQNSLKVNQNCQSKSFENFYQPVTKSNDVPRQMPPEASYETKKTQSDQTEEQMNLKNVAVEPRYEIENIPISEKLMAMHHAHLEQRLEMTDDSTQNEETKLESDYKVEPHIEPGWNMITESHDSGINAQTDSTSSIEVGKAKPVDEVKKSEVRPELGAEVEPEVKPEVKQSLAQKFMNMMGLNDREADITKKTETEEPISENPMESSVDILPGIPDVSPSIQENNISEEANHLHAILGEKLSR